MEKRYSKQTEHKSKQKLSMFISDNADFKPKLFRRNKKGKFILIKATKYQEDITITNIYALNIGLSNFIKLHY
jgi:hypothetical protein